MSIAALNHALSAEFPDEPDDPKLSRLAVRCVGAVIATTANSKHDDEFHGSLDKIAARLRMDRDTVRRAVRHLEAVGVLTVIEARPGRTTRYQWHSVAAPTPRQSSPNPAAYAAPNEGTNCERSSVGSQQAAPTEQPTVNQRADKMLRKYWAWVEARDGHPPRSTNAVGFARLMAHFLGHGVEERPLADAVKALHEAGRPVTRATIDAELDGRRPAPRRQDTVKTADSLRFDGDGNLIGP